MERRLQPQEEPDRSRRHLGPDGQPVGRRLLNLGQQAAPRLGPLVALRQRHRQRAPGALGQPPDQRELRVGVGPEVRDQFHHAVARVRHAERDGLELVRPRPQRRRRVARRRAVVQGPRRREADGARPHGLGGQPAHGRRVLLRRLLQTGGPLAHDVEPQGTVGELRAQIDVVGPSLDRVEVLAEALPRPLDPLVEHGAGDVLHALHEGDEPVVGLRPHRREAHAAIAHHGRRHAVPAARGEARVPGRLSVVVGVDVDEAGRHEQTIGVDLLAPPPRDRTERDDRRPVDRHVGGNQLAAQAVGHQATPDHQIVCRACHHACPSALPGPRGS